jgi:hypothetical protein
MFQPYDQNLRAVLNADKVDELRRAARSGSRRNRRVRIRVGESLVSLGLRLASDCSASPARTAPSA